MSQRRSLILINLCYWNILTQCAIKILAYFAWRLFLAADLIDPDVENYMSSI